MSTPTRSVKQCVTARSGSSASMLVCLPPARPAATTEYARLSRALMLYQLGQVSDAILQLQVRMTQSRQVPAAMRAGSGRLGGSAAVVMAGRCRMAGCGEEHGALQGSHQCPPLPPAHTGCRT